MTEAGPGNAGLGLDLGPDLDLDPDPDPGLDLDPDPGSGPGLAADPEGVALSGAELIALRRELDRLEARWFRGLAGFDRGRD